MYTYLGVEETEMPEKDPQNLNIFLGNMRFFGQNLTQILKTAIIGRHRQKLKSQKIQKILLFSEETYC